LHRKKKMFFYDDYQARLYLYKNNQPYSLDVDLMKISKKAKQKLWAAEVFMKENGFPMGSHKIYKKDIYLNTASIFIKYAEDGSLYKVHFKNINQVIYQKKSNKFVVFIIGSKFIHRFESGDRKKTDKLFLAILDLYNEWYKSVTYVTDVEKAEISKKV